LRPDKEINEQTCRASVVLRGGTGEVVPLNCQREYICITKDGSCEGMTKPEIKKVKSEYELYDVLAEEMRYCWWMYGEGDINYVKDRVTPQNLCSICDQIFFDDSIKELKAYDGNAEIYPFVDGKIKKDEFYKYLAASKMPESEKDLTYSQYIFNQDNFEELKQGLSSSAGKQVTFGTIEIGKPHFIVMGITTEVNDVTWALGGAVVAGIGVLVLVPASVLALPLVGIAAVAVGEGAGGYVGSKIPEIVDFASPQIRAIVVEGER
jgi:hypothetical protein